MVSSRRRLLELEDGLTPGMKRGLRVYRVYGYNRGSGLIEGGGLQLTREGWICNWYIHVAVSRTGNSIE